eukprot:COSAG04_NODE_2412_length_4181_cov_3.810877_5_plen_88_part_00
MRSLCARPLHGHARCRSKNKENTSANAVHTDKPCPFGNHHTSNNVYAAIETHNVVLRRHGSNSAWGLMRKKTQRQHVDDPYHAWVDR